MCPCQKKRVSYNAIKLPKIAMQSILMQPSAVMTADAEKGSLSSNLTENRDEPRSKRAPDVEFVCADELVVNKVLLGELLGLLIHRGRVDRYLSSAGAVSTCTKARIHA